MYSHIHKLIWESITRCFAVFRTITGDRAGRVGETVSLLWCGDDFDGACTAQYGMLIKLCYFVPSRARIYILCVIIFSLFPFFKIVLSKCIYESVSYEKVSFLLKENGRYIWLVLLNPILLHPLSKRRKAVRLKYWNRSVKGNTKKEKRDKNIFRKYLELINNSPYLYSPTRKEKGFFLFCFSHPCLKDLKMPKKKNKKNFRKHLEDML